MSRLGSYGGETYIICVAILLILKLERFFWYPKNRHLKGYRMVLRKRVGFEPFSRKGAKCKKEECARNSVNIGCRKIHTETRNVPGPKMNKFCF